MKTNYRQPNKRQRTADNPALAVEIGGRVRRLRVAAKISQRHLAGLMGVYQSVLCNIEQGIHCPSADKLAQIAAALSCSLDYLIIGREPDQATQEQLNAAKREIERLRSALDNITRFAQEAKTP